jgi:acetylornithine deacetylase
VNELARANVLDPAALLAELIAIPSVNPDIAADGTGEGPIADFIAAWFARHGFEVHRLEQRPGRPSIVAMARGTGGGRSLMFNGHIDTVTLQGYQGDALAPSVVDGRISGRGAFEMKGGVAAMMIAAVRAKVRGIAGDILVACVADQESTGFGTVEVLERFTADAAIVPEPSHLELTVAHKGLLWFDVTVAGRSAAGSRPDLGIDAIAKAGKFLVALEAYDRQLRSAAPHPLLGTGSAFASTIKGGEGPSSYPAACTISLERRTLPGDTADSVEAELQAIIDRLAGADPDFAATIRRTQECIPFEVARTEPVVETLLEVATGHLGAPPVWRGEPFWLDSALIQAAGIPCVLFGVDGGGAHADLEWATIDSLESLTDILAETAVRFCNQGQSRRGG